MENNTVQKIIDCLKSHKPLKDCNITFGFENIDKPTRLKKTRIVVFSGKEEVTLLLGGEIVSNKEIEVKVFFPYTMNSFECDEKLLQIKLCLVLSNEFQIGSFEIGEIKRDSSVDMYVVNNVLTVGEVIINE